MKAYDNGAFFTVTYSPSDCSEFSASWPCSTVRGRGAFVFNKANGDLTNVEGSAARNDGSDWAAFSQDCQLYGQIRLAGGTIANAQSAIWHRRHGKAA